MSSLQKDLIQQGSFPMAVLKQSGSIYRLEPIPDIYPIEFHNLVKGQVKSIQLDNILDKDYQIIGVDFDLADDDEQGLENGSGRPSNITTYVEVRAFINDIQTQRFYYTTAEKVINYPRTIINHRHNWQIKASQNLNSLTFYSVPVFLNKPIIFT